MTTGSKKIKIAALIMVCNEELLLPYFLRHYEHLDEIYVLYETDSTDNTLKILKQTPNVIIKKCHIKDGFDDVDKVNLINKTLRTIKTDWVYVVDCDEFIFPPYESPNDFLSRQDCENYNVVRAGMFQVYRHRTDKDLDPSLPPAPQRVHGDPDLFSTVEEANKPRNVLYVKPIVVKPSSKIWFKPGNHVVEGDIRVSPNFYIGAHWKMADPSIAIDRRMKNKARMSKRNKRLGLTWQDWDVTEEWIRAECDRHLDDPLIEELYLFSNKDFFKNMVDKVGSKEFSKFFKLSEEESIRIRDFFFHLGYQLTIIARLKNNLQELENNLQEKEFQIQQIQQSIVMQLANRYDRVMKRLLPPDTRRRHYYELGLNGIRVILNEGWRSFFGKVRYWFAHRPAALSKPDGFSRLTKGIPKPDRITSLDEVEKLVFRPPANPLVSIIIPAYNQWQYTYTCLNSILENTAGVDYEVIIANDCSTDLTSAMLKKVEGITVINNENNLGFLKNCNKAATFARGKYILFLNNDTYVLKGWLKTMVEVAEKDKEIGILGPNLISLNGKLEESGWIVGLDGWGQPIGRDKNPDDYEYNYLKQVDCVTGACMLVRKDIFLKVGLFDEIYAPGYTEEFDLAFAVREKGYKVMVQPKAKVVHFVNITYGINKRNRLTLKNHPKFLKKWYPVLEKCSKAFNDYFWFRDRSQGKRVILVVDERVPDYDKNTGSLTTYQYTKLFQNLNFKVIFLPDNLEKLEPYTTEMQQSGIEVIYGKFNFDSWLKENGKYLDMVWLSGPNTSIKYLKKLRNQTNARILYYTHGLHCLRERGTLLEKRNSTMRRTESKIFKNVDIIITPSSAEKDIISKEFPEKRIEVIPLHFYEKFPADLWGEFSRNSIELVKNKFSSQIAQEKILSIARMQSNKEGIICLHPFTTMNFFSPDGDTFSCSCPTWPKYNIGNIKHNNIAELWNGDTARLIRRKMYEGEWQDICNPTCPAIIDYLRSNKFIKYEELKNIEHLTPKLIGEIRARKDYLESPPLSFQPSVSGICNLRCIMCGVKQIKDDPAMQKKLWADLEHYLPTAKVIFLTGWGEPFAKPDTRKLLINYKGSAKFQITTNGLLLPKYWPKIKHQKFDSLDISIDAATKETYEKIRVGGKWEDLLRALDLVKKIRDKFEYISINMTVMRSNYREIPQFIDFAESYGFGCFFHALAGKYGNENIFELKDTAVLDELREIIISESSKKRSIDIRWQDLPARLNIPFNINLLSL